MFSTGFRARRRRVGLIALSNCWLMQMVGADSNSRVQELFQRSGPMQAGVWDKMMRGLSTRNYGAVVKEFQRERREPLGARAKLDR